MLFLDDAGGSVGLIARLKLVGELGKVRKELLSLPKDGARAMLARVKLTSRALELRLELGAKQANQAPIVPAESTGGLYEFDESRKAAQRRRENQEAMDLLGAINSGEKNEADLTKEDLATLAKYSGTGGGMVGADGKVGSQYEYYTPAPLAQGAWDLLKELGFEGGKVLDPSAGTGIFGATAPANAVIDAIELDQTSGRINQIVNKKDNVTISAFESVASSTPDEIYDAVVTNIPFGDVASRGKERFKDAKYQNETLEGYFILRSLEKLRPGGLACFISSKGFMSNRGAKDSGLRYRASLMAEFLGAYRLPNKMFDSTGADVVTDVLVFRKFGHDVREKIAELQQQNPEALRSAKVLWEPFLEGVYYKENPRHVLGRVESGKGRFGDVERVINDDSVSNISRMMRRFGGSRIDWAALDASETQPIDYREGDAVTRAGVTFVMRNGKFEPIATSDLDQEIYEKIAASETPNKAIEESVKWDEANQIIDSLMARSQYADIPHWMFEATREIKEHAPKTRQAHLFESLKVAMAVKSALDTHGKDEPFNYAETYSSLHAAIPDATKKMGRVPASLPTHLKDTLRILSGGAVYNSKDNSYSMRWTGQTASLETKEPNLNPTQKYERAKYLHSDEKGFIPIDILRESMGEEFDVKDDKWCISPDGKGVMSADDYYVGSYASFKAKHSMVLDSVDDEEIKSKLIDQINAAEARLIKPNVSALSFTLSSPYVGMDRKAEFLSKYVDSGFSLSTNEDGEHEIAFVDADSKIARNSEELRNMKRFADYIKNGTLSTRTRKEDKESDPELEQIRVERLREIISRSNQQFEAWVKSNPSIQKDLNERFSDPNNLFFKQIDDNSPLDIPGINPNLVPHGYQNACIRRYARKMSGIMGLDVGLGKTFTALLTVQHVQSINVKKKTLFVVPNSTLSNWKKETGTAYIDTSDCLFVGLSTGKDGGDVVNSSNYVRDLNSIPNGAHKKIFMTYEAFSMIRLRDETKEAYAEYMQTADKSFDTNEEKSKSKTVKAEGRLARAVQGAGEGSAAAPYLEDMGVDSIVIDEGHSFKNSKGTSDFKAAKFLASPSVSNRGQDAQIKCWYVRSLSPLGDGVLPLTATPITNSPLEIYSMLTLAVGEVELNQRMGGVRGADDFMEAFCDVSEEMVTNLSGMESMNRVFRGLNNTELLRNVLGEVATIRTAKEVGLKIPEIDEQSIPVQLSEPPIMEELSRLQAVYTYASMIVRQQDAFMEPEQRRLVEDEIEKTGEGLDLLAHPFNFINKVSRLIADPELHDQKTVFIVSDQDKAKAAIDQFNKKSYREERQRPTPLQGNDSVIRRMSKKDGEDTIEVMVVRVEAFLFDGRIEIDSVDYKIQAEFIKIAEKLGLELDVTLPPKIAAMLQNFQKEQSMPQAHGKAKQLIFCDMLGLHNKLKIVLQKRAGVPSGEISIINGVSVTDPADMQDIQDGFNAESKDNRYSVVIANKKAEVGINLQKGTQAIHHLTVGYTPDSIHQRNGRGARQGNYLDKIRVYHYDANGTFDQYKRSIVSKKADWIGEVMSGSGNKVKISSGMSREDMQLLADAAGSEEGMRKAQEAISRREEVERQRAALSSLASSLINMKAQQAVVARYPDFGGFFAEKVADAAEIRFAVRQLEKRYESAIKSENPSRISRSEAALAKARSDYERAMRLINDSVAIKPDSKNNSWEAAFDSRGWLDYGRGREPRGIDRSSIIRGIKGSLEGKGWSPMAVEVKEGAPIYEDWQVEITSAESLANESEQKALALLEAAGMSADRIEEVKSGKADIKRGVVVGVGDFVLDRLDNVWVFTGPNELFCYDMERGPRRGREEVAMAGTIVTREMDGYDRVVSMAATIDARRLEIAGGSLNEGTITYYSINHDVLDRLPTKPMGRGSVSSSILLDEDFKWIVPPGDYDDPVVTKLFERQSKLISHIESSGFQKEFNYDPAKVNVGNGRLDRKMLVVDLGKQAVLMGERLTLDAVDVFFSSLSKRPIALDAFILASNVYDWPSVEEIKGAADSAESSDEANANLLAIFKARFGKLIGDDVFQNIDLVESIPGNLKAEFTSGVSQKFNKADPEDEAVIDGNPDELVAIIGDTYSFKDTIKSTASSEGEKAIFRGKYPSKLLRAAPQNSWIVSRKVYNKLLKEFADEVRQYNISIA